MKPYVFIEPYGLWILFVYSQCLNGVVYAKDELDPLEDQWGEFLALGESR